MDCKKMVTKKSFSRFFAVQVLFAYLLDREDDVESLVNFLEEYYIAEEFSPKDKDEYKKNINIDFMKDLLTNTIKNLDIIDAEISAKLPEKYAMPRIDDIIKDIFRLAVYENNFTDTPRKVIINEYVDIAGEYLDDKGISFVNAILDKILETNQPNINKR